MPSNSFLFDLLKSTKIKSLIINCSSSGILPYSKKYNLKKTGRLYQSVICSDVYLTWSKVDLHVMRKRNLNILKNYKIFVSGPLMFGKFNLVRNLPSILFKKNFENTDKKKIIGIYDLDVKNNENRTRISKKFQERFFLDIIKIIKRFPNIQFIFKPKKDTNKYFNSKSFKYFLNMNAPNLKILNSNIDPYLSMSIVDHGIGMPFTSPVTACNMYKRESIYYDPLKEYSRMYPDYVKRIMIYDYKYLVKKVINWEKKNKNMDLYKKNELFNFQKFLK